ncbi:jun-like transcription factor [Mucor velutinosus]|uniref:Jun-like transcription factor n=1 Tax=Mucor velutinosus TaxID=708070 RepID=A0AAN7DBE9_9FUNG|nr:jun-like transcription factor [Mucor velutinosus]
MDALNSLTDHQRSVLEQYQSRTYSEDITTSIRILRENNWDIELAEQNSYQNTDSRSYAAHHEQDSLSSTSALLGNNAGTNASSSNKRLLWIFMWPFSLAWRIIGSLFHFTARLLYRPSITGPRRDARTEADRFLRDFESTYGTTHPEFFSEGGYTQALKAAKKELKYMLVILCSEEHDDNNAFCRETLTDVELLDFLHQKQVICWAGNVRYTEAYQVSNTLQATTYPFLAIIALQQTNGTSKMSVVDRMEGPLSASSIMRRFDSVIARIGHSLDHLRAERAQRETERRLRQEQDQAYRESLNADQRKQELLQKKKDAALKAKQAKETLARKRRQYIQYLCQHALKRDITPDQKATRISFRLSNGDRVIRQFSGDDTLASLYEYIEAYSHMDSIVSDVPVSLPENYVHQYKFTMHSPFPKTVYLPDPSKKIIDEKGLWPSATLIVDTNEEEEEEEESQDSHEEDVD